MHKTTTLATCALLIIPGYASAQRTVACAPTALFIIEDAVFLPDVAETSAKAYIQYPAVFPKPASLKEISTPFTMKCPDFTAISRKGEFSITGNVQKNFARIMPFWKEGDPDLTGYVKGMIDLGFYGYFQYENIREDWNQERLSIRIKGNRVTSEYDGYNIFLKDAIAAYRINGSALKPIYFDKKYTPLNVSVSTNIEFYVKGENAQVSYVRLDFAKNKIIVRHNTPFPSK